MKTLQSYVRCIYHKSSQLAPSSGVQDELRSAGIEIGVHALH